VDASLSAGTRVRVVPCPRAPARAVSSVRAPSEAGLCEVCRLLRGRRPQRVCSPRCRIARWRQTRAEATAATLAGSRPRTRPAPARGRARSPGRGAQGPPPGTAADPVTAPARLGAGLTAGRRSMPHSGPERRVSMKHLRPPWQPGQSGNPLSVNRGVFALAAEIRRVRERGGSSWPAAGPSQPPRPGHRRARRVEGA
jgi:hypothetical protein